MNKSEITDIIKEFKSEQWSNWIDDILNYGIASPYHSLSDGDVIFDTVNFLRKNGISTIPYEEALAIQVEKFSQPFSDSIKLERLIDALVILHGNKSNRALCDLIISRKNNHAFGRFGYIKSHALLAISHATELSEHQLMEIDNHIRMVAMMDMLHDSAFYGHYLRFSYLHFDDRRFFQRLTDVVKILAFRLEKHQRLEFTSVLVQSLNELHFRRPSFFYGLALSWLISIKEEDTLRNNYFLDDLLKFFCDLLNREDYIEELTLSSMANFDEARCGRTLRFYLNVSFNIPLRNELLTGGGADEVYKEAIEATDMLIKCRSNGIELVQTLLQDNFDYIYEYYSVIPYIIDDYDYQNAEIALMQIARVFDKALFSIPSKDKDMAVIKDGTAEYCSIHPEQSAKHRRNLSKKHTFDFVNNLKQAYID